MSRLTDNRHAALSELANQKRMNINLGHIERIAEALHLTCIQDIMELVDKEDDVIHSRNKSTFDPSFLYLISFIILISPILGCVIFYILFNFNPIY